MCGITGIWSRSPIAESELEARLHAMVATLAHRGPDDRGVWCDDTVGLGASRLAVLDLSASGHQPMSDAGGRAWIAFNGEIYNYRDLRRELAAAGHAFRSGTDTEVIVTGYREWGDAVLDRLRGMFAFALWDGSRLLLARDRIGQKPLYYGWAGQTLVFGSEIKALLAWPGVVREPDMAALDDYLTLRYVPGSATAFRGIERLPPAHCLVIGGDGRPRVRRYWDVPQPPPGRPRPLRDLRDELVARFDEAVRMRLHADVPVGAFLSGGVDSSSVVASMAGAVTGPVRTFTVGFEEAGLDERRYAAAVAARYGTEHHEFVVSPDVAALLPRLVWHYGEPYGDPVAIPTFLLSQLARRHVTVALNGDGGDEAFLGYRRHAGLRVAGWMDRLPAGARAAAARAGRLVPSRSRVGGNLRRFLVSATADPADRYLAWVALTHRRFRDRLYGEALRPFAHGRAEADLAGWFDDAAPPERAGALADLHTFLPDDLLVRLDVASMAHGLEGRSPFLDHELIEFAAAIPEQQRMRGVRTKSLLKSAMRHRLPAGALYRPKRGFPMPLDRALALLKPTLYDVLLSEAAVRRGVLRPATVTGVLDDHFAGRHDRSTTIWALLMLELWFVTWIDGATPPPAPG